MHFVLFLLVTDKPATNKIHYAHVFLYFSSLLTLYVTDILIANTLPALSATIHFYLHRFHATTIHQKNRDGWSFSDARYCNVFC